MFRCPNCRSRLVRITGPKGLMYVCPRCGGRAVGLAVVRRSAGERIARSLWLQGMKKGAVGGKECPICEHWMREIPVPVDRRELRLDLCRECQFVWFDAREFEQLPVEAEKPTPQQALPLEAREKNAVAEIKHRAELEDIQRQGEIGGELPEEPWKWIPAAFDLPVEIDVDPLRSVPWVTWGLSALLVVLFLATFWNLDAVVRQWGMVPNQAFRHGGLTWLTSFFIHGGILHLVGNVYFLLIFGDNVEDHLGRWRYLALLAFSTFCGDLTHVLLEPRGDLPSVGASGGISGVIVFYALQFPRAKLGFLLWYHWVTVPVWIWMGGWVLLQCLGAVQQVEGVSDVSSLAHLGGVAVGVAAWFAWRGR